MYSKFSRELSFRLVDPSTRVDGVWCRWNCSMGLGKVVNEARAYVSGTRF